MFGKLSSIVVLMTLAVAQVSLASQGRREGASWRRHQAIARSAQPDHDDYNATQSLEARAPNSRWTWYNTETGNAGSCGRFLKNSDFVVARAAVDMGRNRDCGKSITLEFEGRTAVATIEDTCPECPPNALDLSAGLFKFIAPKGDGVVHGNWWFNDGSGGGQVTTTKTTTTTTRTSTTSTSTRTTTSSTSTTTSSSTTRRRTSTQPTTTSTSTRTTPTTTTTSTTSTSSAAPTKTGTAVGATVSTIRKCRRKKLELEA